MAITENNQLLRSLLDIMDAALFVLDNNGETEFLNRAARELQKVIGAGDGGASLLNGLVGPELESFNAHSEAGEIARVSDREIGDRFYDITMSRIGGDRVAVVFHDVSCRNEARRVLKHRGRLEQLVARISAQLIGAGTGRLEVTIQQSLRQLGEETGVDRTYLFRLDSTSRTATNTYEWCGPGVAPMINELQDVPFAEYSGIIESILRNEPCHIPDVTDVPAQWRDMAGRLAAQGIRSLLLVPILSGDDVTGILGLDMVREARSWAEEDIVLLRMVSNLLSAAELRLETYKELRESSTKLDIANEELVTTNEELSRINIQLEKNRSELRESEQRFRDISMSLGEWIWEINELGQIHYTNDAIERILGLEAAELYGKRIADLVLEEERAQTGKALEEALSTGSTVRDVTAWFACRDGKPVCLELSARPYYDNHGGMLGLRGVGKDTTARKEAEVRLETAHQQLMTLFDSINEPIFVTDIHNHEILYVNEACRETFGAEIGHQCFERIHRKDNPCEFCNSEQLLEARAEPLVREQFNSYTKRFYRTVERAIEWTDGRLVRYEMMVDITDWKKTTDRLEWESAVNQALADVSAAMIRTISREEVSGTVLEHALALTSAEFGFVATKDPRTNDIVFDAAVGDPPSGMEPPPGEPVRFKPDADGNYRCLWSSALRHMEGMYTNDPANHPEAEGLPTGHIPIANFLSVPAMIGDELVGQIALAGAAQGFEDKQLDAIQRLGDLFAIAIDRQRGTEQLVKSEEQFRTLFNASGDAVMVHGIDPYTGALGRFTQVNEIALERYGYPLEELRQMTPLDIDVSPTVKEDSNEVPNDLLKRGQLLFETIHRTKDGQDIPVEVNCHLFELDDQLRVLSVVRDVTERRDAEEALRRSEQRLRNIISKTPVGLCITTEDGIFEFVNDAYCSIYGYQPEELVGKPFTMMAPAGRAQAFMEQHDKFLRDGQEIRGQWRVRGRDGKLLTILADAALITGDDGRPRKATFVVDITESKNTEEQLRKMALFAELSPSPVMRIDYGSRILMANPTAHLAFSSEQLTGEVLSELMPEFAAVDVRSAIEEAQRFQFTAKIGDRTFTFHGRGIAEMGFAQIYGSDITDLVAERQRAEMASRAKSEFLANMSHELRTPLSAINGFSEVLLEQAFDGLNDDQLQYIGRIRTSGEHLLSLINDLLDLAKIEAGKLELIFSEINLVAVCRQATDLVGGRIDREKHKLIFDFPEEAVSVEADDLRIRQVVINLLGNAIKFTKQGTITVWLREDGEHVVFGVRDTGIGIAKEKLPLLFRRFEQVHERKAMTEAGTGLGLALCRQIIEAHHGSIHVESELGEGSNFYCRLPRHRPQNGDGSDG